MTTCLSCAWHKHQNIRGRLDDRCMRPLTLRVGGQISNVSCVFETDNYPENHRVDGDKCGAARRHWRAKAS